MSGDLAFIGDVHLDQADELLEPFLEWLDRLEATCTALVFIGDLFNLWLGDRSMERPHQTAVVDRLVRLRERGMAVTYIEGNRDYRIGDAYAGLAFDEVVTEAWATEVGPTRVLAAHGDLVNVRDRQYQTWRRFSRWAPAWKLFTLVPSGPRLRWADRIEQRMRATNLANKATFPEDLVRRYGGRAFGQGHDLVVLGHFHLERDLRVGPGRIVVLPSWRDGGRFLRIAASGEAMFETAPA